MAENTFTPGNRLHQQLTENFCVTINDHVIFETSSFVSAVGHAWKTISEHDIPPQHIDVKRRLSDGTYQTIWDIYKMEKEDSLP